MWVEVRQHFREVLILQAHARAYPIHQTNAVLETPESSILQSILDATNPDGLLPLTEDFVCVQRRVAVEGGRAVNALYGIVGVENRQNPDGSSTSRSVNLTMSHGGAA